MVAVSSEMFVLGIFCSLIVGMVIGVLLSHGGERTDETIYRIYDDK
jgi:ABC-type dipeptide/oligopeptide/nickel transport system permease subunit